MKYEVKTHSKPGSTGPDWQALKASNAPRITHQSPYLPFREKLRDMVDRGHLSVNVQHDDRSYNLDDGSLMIHTVFETREGAETYCQFLNDNPYIISSEIVERPDL